MSGWKGYLSFAMLLVKFLGMFFQNECNCNAWISCGKIMHILSKDNTHFLEGTKVMTKCLLFGSHVGNAQKDIYV